MGELADGFDASFMVGEELTHISIFSNQLYFIFDPKLRLRVEGSYICRPSESDQSQRAVAAPRYDARAAEFLDRKIVAVEIDASESLHLAFENGGVLVILKDDEQPESFHIEYEDWEIHV